MLPRWAYPRGWRLSSRMAAMMLLLLLLLQLFSFAAIRASIERNARVQLQARLQVGERIWTRLVDQRAAKLAQSASLLAADYGFRSAVSSEDRETINSALDNQGARIDAALTALLDTRYGVKAVAGGADLLPALSGIAPKLAERGSVVVPVAGRPVQFVMVPMRAPLLVGWVVMGFELDRSLLEDLRAVAGLHGSLVIRDAAAAAEPGTRMLQSTLDASSPEHGPAYQQALHSATAPGWVQRSVAVSAAEGAQVQLQLAGSLDEAIAPYRKLQLFLAALTVLGLLLFGAASVWSARRVTQPLRALVHVSEQLGRGEYDVAVLHTDRGDEIGELARAFEHMRVNIGTHAREIRQLAYWDRLTGLPNRVQFRDAVLAAMQGGGPSPATAPTSLAVVMLDLDRFKHVNDVLGYASGDRLLQGVAVRLQQVVRQGDVIARLGGDEFAMLLPHTDAEGAVNIAKRIASEFEAPLALDDQQVDLSAAVGIACWPQHASEADALLSRAEVAMYAAKRRTAGAMLYDAKLDNGSAQTLSLLGELRRAVEQGELRLFLQPKIAVDGRTISGAEALVRWQHPERGLVPPIQFIPFAEQTGYVRELTLWMFDQVAAQQAALIAIGVDRVSVNLSTRDLMYLELPEKLELILRRHQALASAICLEITESAIMDDPERAEGTINRLSARGFKLSIDDFGTGYSSLAYLRRLPVDELKIDKSFVMGMVAGEDDAKIVRSTIDLAHNLGLTVVAEGVESAEILHDLAALGCDEAQGYHMSKPLPMPAFVAWVEKWSGVSPVVLPPATVPVAEAVVGD